MAFSDIYRVSGSAMTAQTVRLNTIASNLANAETPAVDEGNITRRVVRYLPRFTRTMS